MTQERIKRLLNTSGKNFFLMHIEDIESNSTKMKVNPDFKRMKKLRREK